MTIINNMERIKSLETNTLILLFLQSSRMYLYSCLVARIIIFFMFNAYCRFYCKLNNEIFDEIGAANYYIICDKIYRFMQQINCYI